MQKKNGKEHAAGEQKIEVHLHEAIGRAGAQGPSDISWPPSPTGTVSSTAFALSHMTGGSTGAIVHQPAVVAYGDGQLPV